MKKLLTLTAAWCAALTLAAQTLNIHRGNVTVAVSAADAGTMTFDGGTALTVLGTAYAIADIDSITVDRSDVTPASVTTTYNGTSAHVRVSADIAPSLTISVTGADVTIAAATDLATEVAYTLTGTSADGSFLLSGKYKSTLVLSNLTLTKADAPAIAIDNGKRIAVSIPTGTTTTLTGAGTSDYKAAFYVKGHPEFTGGGTLSVASTARHAYASDEYTLLKKDFGTFNVTASANDGMHIGQYLEMRGGSISVSGTTGDCIDVAVTKDATDELNGQVLISGGTMTLDVAAADVKGLKCDSALTISGGTVSATVSGLGTKGFSVGTDLLINQSSGNATAITMAVTGTTYMPGDDTLESKCRGIKVKGNFTFDGGNIAISATGAKSKAISVDGTYTYKSGTINCKVDTAG